MAFLTVENQRKLYYVDEGFGQPVVFIHGWKASSNVFERSSRALAETGKYRCVRYDHCGHMRSDLPAEPPTLATLAEDLREVLTQLKLEKPILVGWSMGGMTIFEYIRRYGCEDLDRVVIVDIGPRSMIDDTWAWGSYDLEKIRRDAVLMEQDFDEFLRQYYCRSNPGYAEKSLEEQKAIVRERMVGQNSRVLSSLWTNFAVRDHRDVLPKITCPAAIFHAGKMPACMPEAARYCVEQIPGPTYRVFFEENSHGLMTEAPDRFLAELKTFFEMT